MYAKNVKGIQTVISYNKNYIIFEDLVIFICCVSI
jgi:hypothetical protein